MGDSTGVDGFGPDADASYPSDEIPSWALRRGAGRFDFQDARPRRRARLPRAVWLVLLVILFAVSLFGFGGSIHSYTRDLGAYDAYNSAPSCTAADAVDGNVSSEYCDVTDGVVNGVYSAGTPLYSLGVGPALTAQSLAAGLGNPTLAWVADPTQQAFFNQNEPALAGLQVGDPVDYIALSGGDVVSLTVHGVTYQTFDSPQPQQYFDAAQIVSSSAFVLLFGFWIALRLARRRLATAWSAPLVACVAALATDAAIAGTSPHGGTPSIGSLVLHTVLISLCAALLAGVLATVAVRRAAQSSATAMSNA